MLNNFELLFSIIGGWTVSITLYLTVKRIRGETLPNGSIVIESKDVAEGGVVAGYSRLLLTGMGVTSFLTFFVVIISIFNLWNIIASFIAIDFPRWLNWMGIIGIWIQDGWGTAVILYNVNYTPAYKPMKENYVLATGGPYKVIKHPMYIAKAILVIFFFLATGIWLSLFGLLSWIALSSQAEREENALKAKFGEVYETYCKKVGRFFPKVRK